MQIPRLVIVLNRFVLAAFHEDIIIGFSATIRCREGP
jgi:hypothetical protein